MENVINTLRDPAFNENGREKGPVGKLRTRWHDYVEDLDWNRLTLHLRVMQSVLVDRKMWRLNLELLAPQPSRKKRVKKKERNLLVSTS